MLWFKNDYGFGAVPEILAALQKENSVPNGGYGIDPWCEKAAALIQSRADVPLYSHFLEGGTQANATVIDACLRPWESAVAAETGHINAHETGAVEHLGHKIETVKGRDFKVTAEEVREKAALWKNCPIKEHFTQPKLVYVSQTTEMGTLYSKAELEALREVCDEFGLYLYVDGARLAYALGSPENDVSIGDLARLSDVFYIGGTKCGALYGEAVVFRNRTLQESFRASMKQNGAMASKGWLLGIQFSVLMAPGFYENLGKAAVHEALRIRDAFRKKGVELASVSPTNQQFVLLTDRQFAAFADAGIVAEDEGRSSDGRIVTRFCTSWATKPEETDEVIRLIGTL